MGEPLDDVQAKLCGADERLDKLKEVIGRGAVTDLLRTRTDRDRKGRIRVRVKELAEIPQEWHVWIGECVHDMRSALDHLAYSLNVAGSRRNPPPNEGSSQFPIFSRQAKFREMARRRADKSMLGFFPRGARTLAERHQPYHRGEYHDFDTDPQWLEVLAELSNIDKHRRFPVTAVTPMLIATPRSINGHMVTEAKTPRYRMLKNDATIMWLTIPTLPPGPKAPDVQFPYACGLNFYGKAADPPLPLVLPYEPVDFVLPNILKHIRETVLPAFQPFASWGHPHPEKHGLSPKRAVPASTEKDYA